MEFGGVKWALSEMMLYADKSEHQRNLKRRPGKIDVPGVSPIIECVSKRVSQLTLYPVFARSRSGAINYRMQHLAEEFASPPAPQFTTLPIVFLLGASLTNRISRAIPSLSSTSDPASADK